MAHADYKRSTYGNLANQITGARIALCLVLFAALHWKWYLWSVILFAICASTDWLDGFVARRWNLVSQLGRVIDPLADKILICGTYVYLSAISVSGIPPWMAVVVVVREFIVTALRSALEQQGQDFSAKMPGKIKMVLQSLTAIVSLVFVMQWQSGLAEPSWGLLVQILAWAMVVSTVYSGGLYVVAAARLFRTI